jgi:8-oxo-dGTP pyrophosphatase MutT (NUDIX family)
VTRKTLYHNKWLSLCEVDCGNGESYVYAHETRCDGKIVSVLPFRYTDVGVEFLLRYEVCPCFGPEHILVTVTGGVEEDNPLKTAVRELREETGYDVDESEMIALGTVIGAKSIDSIYYLYAVDLTDKEPGEVTGDGSDFEKSAYNQWKQTVLECFDPNAYVAEHRLQVYMWSSTFGEQRES